MMQKVRDHELLASEHTTAAIYVRVCLNTMLAVGSPELLFAAGGAIGQP